jgi:hypothetical protein
MSPEPHGVPSNPFVDIFGRVHLGQREAVGVALDYDIIDREDRGEASMLRSFSRALHNEMPRST